MALIRNGSNQLTGLSRHYGAVGAYGLRSALDCSGQRKNFDSGEHAVANVTNKAAIPEGFRHPMSWKMGTKAGSLSSHVEGDITLSPTGAMLRGYPIDGSTTITISTNTPAGQLIVSGTGSTTLTISTNTPLLTASLGGTGSAIFTISTNTPTLGAEASLIGSAALTLTGTLVAYAIGHMEGTTEEAGLTNAGVANSVWSKVIEAGYSADQILRILAASVAGSATGLEGANPQFTGLDGTTVRIDGTYAAGTRTIDALNGD